MQKQHVIKLLRIWANWETGLLRKEIAGLPLVANRLIHRFSGQLFP
jgi:hypothetical protein